MAKNYSPEIAKAVEEFFTKEELNYIPCNENGVIRSGMMLSSQIHRVDIYMDIRKDGYSMISVFPLHAEEKARPAIAEFLTRANYEINLGCFDMDFEDGEIRYKMAQFCGATVPTYEQIQKIFYVAITRAKKDVFFTVNTGVNKWNYVKTISCLLNLEGLTSEDYEWENAI